jgi:hypothetical protein
VWEIALESFRASDPMCFSFSPLSSDINEELNSKVCGRLPGGMIALSYPPPDCAGGSSIGTEREKRKG